MRFQVASSSCVFQIELKSGDTAEQQELLLRLFSLLLENVRELLDDDNWLRGQIEVVQNLIAGPIDHRALQEATRSLKDVIYKQGALKHSLAESKTSVKNMMAAFIDRLDVMTHTTENYQHKMTTTLIRLARLVIKQNWKNHPRDTRRNSSSAV